MILELGCHVGPWAAQDPPGTALGAAFLTLESRQVGHVFKRSQKLDIYVQGTDFNISN